MKDILCQVNSEGEGKYVHPLNNVSEDSSDIDELRQVITTIVNDRFQEETVPTAYLLLHLILRMKFEKSPGWCFYEKCEMIAESCGISKRDLPDVLEYLHDKFGTVLYYRNLKISNRVIVDVNLIMKPPAKLIESTFGAEEHIRQTGEVSKYLMNKVCSSRDSESRANEIPTDEIVELLDSRCIL